MRYFDKTFFKFTFGFLIIIAISLLIIYAASAYAAGVEKIVFITEPQSIKPNTLSEPITVQTQDSNGDPYQTPETLDIQFISTSATPEFLNSAGQPATTYMSKNTANRTFYYRDSSEGNFKITINTRGRDSGTELSISQQIAISSGSSQNNNTNSSGEVLSASTENPLSSESATSGAVAPTYSTTGSQLEISAGGDRLTTPGSPISFQATIKKNSVANSAVSFSWSFGDGNVGEGALVSHIYKYPGEYAVVLNAKAGNTFAVARLKAKVVKPDISVSSKDGYIEITNNGSTEINLFNWKIEDRSEGFIFQPDTIILPHSSVCFDKNLLTMKGYDNSSGTMLKNNLGQIVFSADPVRKIDHNQISKDLDEIKQKFTIIQEKAKSLGLVQQNINPHIQLAAPISSEISLETDFVQMATDTENVIYEAPKQTGLISRLTNFIKGVFFK